MRIHIRKISPPSLALTLGIIYGGIGLFVLLLGSFGALIQFGIGSQGARVSEPFGMLLIQPIISALVGVISGFIFAWVYNLIARFTKGVLIEYSEAGQHDD